MLTEPSDLERGELETVLERHWALDVAELAYLPGRGGAPHRRSLHRHRGAIYVAGFRRPHHGTEDVVASWGYLREYLPVREL